MASDLLIAISSLFPVFLLGFLSMRLIAGDGKGNQTLASIAVNFGIGAGLLYLILFLSSAATGYLRPSAVYTGLAALAVLNIYYRKTEFKNFSRPRKEDFIGIALAILISSVILIPAIDKALDGDGWAIWAFKAKVFFEDGRIASSFLTDMERYAYAHLDYPLLVPLLEYWVYFHLGHVNDHVIRLVPISIWILMLSFFYSTLSERIKRRHALLGTALLAFTWPIAENAVMGLVDGVQAFYNLIGLVYLFRWLEDGERENLWTSALILGFGANVKNEGLGFWLLTSSVLILFSLYRVITGRSYAALLPSISFFAAGIAICAPWLIAKKVYGIGSELFIRGLPSTAETTDRLSILSFHYLKETVNIWHNGWGLLWVFTALTVLDISTVPGLKKGPYKTCFLICLFQLMTLTAVYLITPYDFNYHITSSSGRTLLQIVPAVLWIGMNAGFRERTGEKPETLEI